MKNLASSSEFLPNCPKKPQPSKWDIYKGKIKGSIILILLLMMLVIFSNPLDVFTNNSELSGSFSQTYGAVETDDNAQVLIQTSDGGFAIAGITWSYGSGQSDMWLIKTDSIGNPLWNKTYGSPDKEWARDLLQTSDGGYALAGGTWSIEKDQYDMWLVKTDSQGQQLWNRTYGGSGTDQASALLQTADNGFVLAGYTTSYGMGNGDMWLVKTDENGQHVWNNTYGGREYDMSSALVQTIDGGFAIAGETWSFGAGSNDMFLVQTDNAGQIEWSQTYGGNGREWAKDLVYTSDGGFALAGSSWMYGDGYRDMWLVKTNSKGELLWDQRYGGSEKERTEALIQTKDGGFALAGYTTTLNGSGYVDALLVKTGPNGLLEWNSSYGGEFHDIASSLIQTSDKGIIFVGITDASWYVPYYGGGDIRLAKVNSKGNFLNAGGEQFLRTEVLGILLIISIITITILWNNYKKEKKLN